jgi:TPR repeat protein
MYETGMGVTRDLQQALYWYGQAAARGSAWAEWNLGRMHQEGLGVPADEVAAIEHFRRAARGGHEKAITVLREKGVDWR